MFYLFLAILCSSLIAFIFKYAEADKTNKYVITSANYFIASSISFTLIVKGQLLQGLVKEYPFFVEWKFLLSQDHYLLSPYNSVLWGVLLGAVSGFFFFFSFLYYQKSVQENGLGLSGTFAKLGILIPMIFSIIIWKEIPTSIQWLGIVLSLVSIVMVNTSFESAKKLNLNASILFLFVFGGMAEFSNKIYQQYALSAYKDVFLFSVFFVAFIISFIYAQKKKAPWKI